MVTKNQFELLEWLTGELQQGRLKLQPIEDDNGNILAMTIVYSDDESWPAAGSPRPQIGPSPNIRRRPESDRKTRPL